MILTYNVIPKVQVDKYISDYQSKTITVDQITKEVYLFHKKEIDDTIDTCLLKLFKHRSKVRYVLSLGAQIDEERIISKNEFLELTRAISSLYSQKELLSEVYLILYKIVFRYFRRYKPKSSLSRYVDKYLYIEIIRWIRKHYDKLKYNIAFIGTEMDNFENFSQNDTSYSILYDQNFMHIPAFVKQRIVHENTKHYKYIPAHMKL